MRLFQSEMLQAPEHAATASYRVLTYGPRYDRRARRASVPALMPTLAPIVPCALAEAPRDILFQLAEIDRAA